LAAVHAALGQFDEAVDYQDKAVKMESEPLRKYAVEKLELYRKKKSSQ
jgi:hypothetical protein